MAAHQPLKVGDRVPAGTLAERGDFLAYGARFQPEQVDALDHHHPGLLQVQHLREGGGLAVLDEPLFFVPNGRRFVRLGVLAVQDRCVDELFTGDVRLCVIVQRVHLVLPRLLLFLEMCLHATQLGHPPVHDPLAQVHHPELFPHAVKLWRRRRDELVAVADGVAAYLNAQGPKT